MTGNSPYDQLLIALAIENGELNEVYDVPQPSGTSRYYADLDVIHHVTGLPDTYRKSTWGESPRCGWDTGEAELDVDGAWPGDRELSKGIVVSKLRCRCGELTDIDIYWEVSTAEVLHAVMRRLTDDGAIDFSKVRP